MSQCYSYQKEPLLGDSRNHYSQRNRDTRENQDFGTCLAFLSIAVISFVVFCVFATQQDKACDPLRPSQQKMPSSFTLNTVSPGLLSKVKLSAMFADDNDGIGDFGTFSVTLGSNFVFKDKDSNIGAVMHKQNVATKVFGMEFGGSKRKDTITVCGSDDTFDLFRQAPTSEKKVYTLHKNGIHLSDSVKKGTTIHMVSVINGSRVTLASIEILACRSGPVLKSRSSSSTSSTDNDDGVPLFELLQSKIVNAVIRQFNVLIGSRGYDHTGSKGYDHSNCERRQWAVHVREDGGIHPAVVGMVATALEEAYQAREEKEKALNDSGE